MLIDTFHRDGFVVIPTVVTESQCDAIAACVARFDSDSPGTRSLLTHNWCRALAHTLRAHVDVEALIPAGHVAVQCTYFEKSVDKNWLVPIHQDLSIPVRERVDHPALRGWSEKEGALFVQPPAELLETLVAVRVHLNPCMDNDGPLQFVPATYTRGRIDAAEASRFRRDGPVVTCTVDRGGGARDAASRCTRHRRRRERAGAACCTSCSGRPHCLRGYGGSTR